MPKTKRPDSAPPLRVHKATGQAYVILDGQRRYIGRHDAPETQARYRRLVAEWSAGVVVDASPDMTIAEMLAAFWLFAETYHGEHELGHFRRVAKPLRELYGDTPAASFTPPMLKVVRQTWIDAGNARPYVNSLTARVKRMFKWAVSEGLIPPSVHHGLMAVDGLRAGKCQARETEPVRPVADGTVDKTLPFLTPTVRAMVELQRLTGARPGEVCNLRTADVDVSGKVWVYTPQRHKTQHRGRERKIFIGPRGQDVLRPFLKADLQAYVFSPERSESERRAELTKRRKTPKSCGNVVGSNRKRRPRKMPGDKWTVRAYATAVAAACRKAFPPSKEIENDPEAVRQWHREHRWGVNRLRHSFATKVRRDHGVDLAGSLLGHAPGSTITATYAERAYDVAAELASRIG